MKNLSFVLILCFIGIITDLNADYVFFNDTLYSFYPEYTCNSVHYLRPTTDSMAVSYIAVGSHGRIVRLYKFGQSFFDQYTIGSGDWDLTGVSFAPGTDTGWIVGYKVNDPYPSNIWKGAIWKTTDRGSSWSPQTPPTFPGNIAVPFLDVHAVNSRVVWISCGNGYVLKTYDGGYSWHVSNAKPGGPNHYGWLWGIWAPDNDTSDAWICSDQSGLISFTSNGGESWTDYYPFLHHTPPDTFSYRHICGDPTSANTVYAAGSKGTIVYTTDGGNNWVGSEPFDGEANSEWVNGIFPHEPYVWCVGTGGTIADDNGDNNFDMQLLWFSKKYNFMDIDGGASIPAGGHTYLAVGTSFKILGIRVYPGQSNPGGGEGNNSEQFDIWTEDVPNDNGWRVRGGWNSYPGATLYKLYLLPPPDTKLTTVSEWGKLIGTFDANETLFTYDSVLNGYTSTFTVLEYEGTNPGEYDDDEVVATDDTCKAEVTNFRGWFNSVLQTVVLQWDTLQSGLLPEPNMGGYWVCPEESKGINHPTPIYRNYYIESLPVSCTSAVFQVCITDRSGHKGPWSDPVYIRPHTISSNSPYATAFNQGRHLARFAENNMLQIVYEDRGKIIYSYSQDNGVHWSRDEIDDGYFPSIGVDNKGHPWVAYWKEGDIACKVKRPNGTWKDLEVYDGNGTTTWAGAPAIAMGTIPPGSPLPPFAYIAYPVYEGEALPNMPSASPYQSTYNCIKLSILDTITDNIANYSLDVGDGDNQVGDPAIAVTPADYIHIVWQKGGEIWYSTNLLKITPYNWHFVQMAQNVNISGSPESPSIHPFVETYGDRIIAAWREGAEANPGEIFRRTKVIGSPFWGVIENISQSPTRESDYPVLATSDVLAYQEKVGDTNYEIYAWINGDYVNLSETEKASKYPHIIVEPPKPHEPEVLIDAVWTEEIRQDTLYEVKFKQYRHPINPDGFGEYLSVTIGDSVASPYCEQRDGRIDYGEFSCDYDNSSLIYTIPYLNPVSNYLLRAVVYKEGSQSGKEEVYVDTTFVTEVNYQPYVPETVYVMIPKETYADDFEVGKEIEKILGNYALIADLKVFEVSLSDTSGEGGQSAGRSKIIRTVLYQNNPNPFKATTEIAFGLAREGNVSLSIFDASGRMVRNLINNRLKPDNYRLRWDGKDNMMRNLAQGVYFYTLKIEDFKSTKKLILLK